MLTTLELRWFNHGKIPLEVDNWFTADCPGKLLGAPAERPEDREDWYLYVPSCEYLNVKLRHGNLELKWRKTQLGVWRFDNGWQGKVEQWLKWTGEDLEQQSFIPVDTADKKPWVGVRKIRKQRQHQGISCEITQLSISQDTWWTFAFEMPCDQANSINSFNDVLSQISQTYQGPELSVENSCAYPGWLSLLT